MTHLNECPECGKFLRKYTKRCGCGWMQALDKRESASDYQCQFEINGRRCPLPSTNSPSPRANGAWYCREHWRNLADPLTCEMILIDATKNYHQIVNEHVDWRRELFPDDFKINKR